MAEEIQNAHTDETDGRTDASVSNAIRYLDSSTDYREHLTDRLQPTSLEVGGFITQDESLRLAWDRVLNLCLIAILACLILLLAPRT
jgi:hypothetical protein